LNLAKDWFRHLIILLSNEKIILRQYIMALIVGHNGPSAYANTIANRTGASGGSVGGVKKAGIWGGNVFMKVYNVGNSYTYRISNRVPSLAQANLLTTRNPVQYRRGSYYATHSGTLG